MAVGFLPMCRDGYHASCAGEATFPETGKTLICCCVCHTEAPAYAIPAATLAGVEENIFCFKCRKKISALELPQHTHLDPVIGVFA